MTHARTPLHGPVLVTGASSGIGRATAVRMARAGHTVYATTRSPAPELQQAGCINLHLDVTEESSMASVVETIEAAHGSVGTLVNNAGYSEFGPAETVSVERWRRQFDTNLFGLIGLTQLVLPGMRSAGRGRIVNIGSVYGRFTMPMFGPYSASKHAVEAFSDALRMEVARFGIRVVLIEPGFVRTSMIDSLHDLSGRHREDEDSPYSEDFRAVRANVGRIRDRIGTPAEPAAGGSRALMSAVAALAADPDKVARAITHAATARRPRPRYLTPGHARPLVLARGPLGDRVWDTVTRAAFARAGGGSS